ncbi:hypothetical protein K2173_017080 [Erythroxylum novogranatense]|uniref:Uncharacterized protein n=1 Tax=Erythroxylum novogranatense TaxID=1862640 RepID=A0AAV8U8Y6_9ROSI|nr:hypothetical protein K2173_017080 [Erythroxylum novogranatense]
MAFNAHPSTLIVLLYRFYRHFQYHQNLSFVYSYISITIHKLNMKKANGMLSGHDKVVAETKKMIGGRKMSMGVLRETSMNAKGSVEEDGFVAFNEDYHSPQHHPPRHN